MHPRLAPRRLFACCKCPFPNLKAISRLGKNSQITVKIFSVLKIKAPDTPKLDSVISISTANETSIQKKKKKNTTNETSFKLGNPLTGTDLRCHLPFKHGYDLMKY